MRFSLLFTVLLSAPVFALLAFAPLQAAERDELLSIVQRSCQKACVEGRGQAAYCQKYCGCVRGRVETLSNGDDLASVLENTTQQQSLIQHCSGETAVLMFASSCRQKCKKSAKCDAYCACLETRISDNRKFSEIGQFFIGLGKNEEVAIGQLKSYEAACSQQDE